MNNIQYIFFFIHVFSIFALHIIIFLCSFFFKFNLYVELAQVFFFFICKIKLHTSLNKAYENRFGIGYSLCCNGCMMNVIVTCGVFFDLGSGREDGRRGKLSCSCYRNDWIVIPKSPVVICIVTTSIILAY